MEKHQCYICRAEMKVEHKISFIDHYCAPRWDDHHLTIRIKDGKMIKLRLRFQDENNRQLHLKMHYDEGYCEVWGESDTERIKINRLIDLDFSDMPKLRNKIKTYITFS